MIKVINIEKFNKLKFTMLYPVILLKLLKHKKIRIGSTESWLKTINKCFMFNENSFKTLNIISAQL